MRLQASFQLLSSACRTASRYMDAGVKGPGIRYGRGEEVEWTIDGGGESNGGANGGWQERAGGQGGCTGEDLERLFVTGSGGAGTGREGAGVREQEMRTCVAARKVYVRPSVKTCLR